MDQSNSLKFLVLLFIINGFIFGREGYKPLSLTTSIILGHDSNPLRLSEDEIMDLEERPYLLGDASDVYSRFISFNGKFSFYSRKTPFALLFKKKTIFNISYTYKHFIDHEEKTSQNISLKIDHQLGGYRHIYINYFLMPNYYLRQYEDLDYIIGIDNIEDISRYYSCVFDTEKISLLYQKPLKSKKNKVKFGVFYEREIYSKYFTEFDLNIIGRSLKFTFNSNNHNYFKGKRTVAILHERKMAENNTFLNGIVSTSFMDRGYKQSRYKLSFKQIIDEISSFGFILDTYKRNNTSPIENDELHYKRKHTDTTLSMWYRKNKYKINLSKRKRLSSSPFQWVQDLKTFDRYIITLTVDMKKKKF